MGAKKGFPAFSWAILLLFLLSLKFLLGFLLVSCWFPAGFLLVFCWFLVGFSLDPLFDILRLMIDVFDYKR